MLLNQDKVKNNQDDFIQAVIDGSNSIGIDPNWLMAAMDLETAGTFSPSIQNSSTKATGLIQFMPDTAKALGTSVDDLKQMSNVDQLDYVFQYLKPYSPKIKSFVDLYLTIFFPAAVGQPDSFIIQAKNLSASLIAKLNPLFDLNKDGKITVAEIQQVLLNRIPESLWASFKKRPVISGLGLLLLGAGLFFGGRAIYRRRKKRKTSK